MKITPVILCGGVGSRLWPISRRSYPKQFLQLFDDLSLFQKTILRFKGKKIFHPPIIVCNDEHRFIVAQQLSEIKIVAKAIIVEPCSKNTAGAIALASQYIVKNNISSQMVIMPSDHLVDDENEFFDKLIHVQKYLAKDFIVTFGIKPQTPETGFGYIEKSKALDKENGIFAVNKFIEKPSYKVAQKLLLNKNFFWNSGIFAIDANFYNKVLKKFNPLIYKHSLEAVEKLAYDLDFVRVGYDEFNKCPDISVDYALLEKVPNIAIVPLKIKWSDVGSWKALGQILTQDNNKNNIKGEVALNATKNCIIYSDHQFVATHQVEDLIIVATKDAVLVTSKKAVQNIKNLYELIKENHSQYCAISPKTYRPWGSFEIINQGTNYKVKKIIIKPNCAISLQKHRHRAEHWIVVKGVAAVSREKEKFMLTENQSTFIAQGVKHRLENNQKIDLEIIEVQSGDYLEEDDIVRFNDKYGRKS